MFLLQLWCCRWVGSLYKPVVFLPHRQFFHSLLPKTTWDNKMSSLLNKSHPVVRGSFPWRRLTKPSLSQRAETPHQNQDQHHTVHQCFLLFRTLWETRIIFIVCSTFLQRVQSKKTPSWGCDCGTVGIPQINSPNPWRQGGSLSTRSGNYYYNYWGVTGVFLCRQV